jgi:hypothetical protein
MTIAAEKHVDIPIDQQIRMCIVLSRFVCFLLGISLYIYQIRLVNQIIEATLRAEGDELLVLQARQSGKTEAVTVAIITLSIFFVSVLKRDFKCGVFAPAQSQAIQVTRDRMRTRMGSIKEPMLEMGITTELDAGKTTGLYLLVDLNSGATATVQSKSAAKSAHTKGADLNLTIVEQVEDADDTVLKETIFPMMAATGGARVLSGTATSEIRCEYYYNRMTLAGEEAIVIDCDEAAKYNPKYALYLEKEKVRLGEDSLEFRAAYKLEWGITFIHFIEDRPAFLALSEDYIPKRGLIKVAGWDPAKINDRSVVTAIEGMDESHVFDWWVSQGTNLEEQVFAVIDWCVARKISLLVVDEVGLGQGVCDLLENHLPDDITLMRVNMNLQFQDEMFKLLGREIRSGRFHYLKTPKNPNQARARELFVQEMLRVEKKFRGRYLVVEAPKGKNMHDDFVDSGALALWGLKGDVFDGGVEVFSYSG